MPVVQMVSMAMELDIDRKRVLMKGTKIARIKDMVHKSRSEI